jgi:hypothetical protein
MAASVADILRWDPEAARDVARAANGRATAASDVASGLHRLPAFATWEGNGADSAYAANTRLQFDLEAHREEATSVGRAAGTAADGMEKVQSDLRRLQWEAQDVGMEVDPASSQIVPRPGFRGTPAQLAANLAELEPRLAAIQAEAQLVEMEFASAITTSGTGRSRPTVQAVDNHTIKEDPPLPPPKPNPSFPGRDVNGRFLPGNTGSVDGATAAQQILEDRAARTGKDLITQQVRVAVTDPQTGQPMVDPKTGGPLYRYYDALEPTSTPGHYTGVEVKSGSASLTPNQRLFDGRVNSGLPATGTLNGQPITIDRAIELRGPAYVPGDGASIGRAAGTGAPAPLPTVVEPPAPQALPAVEAPRPPAAAEAPFRVPLGGVGQMPVPTLVEPPGVNPGHEELPLLGEDPEQFFFEK